MIQLYLIFQMDLFFSPPVRTYSLLVPHHQAPNVVEALISTGFVEFEMSPYDNSTDPFHIVESRIRSLKHRLNSTISLIREKYHQEGEALSEEKRGIAVGRMKDYIDEKQLDYLRYLDMEEEAIKDKLDRFAHLTQNHDSISGNLEKSSQELDLVRTKLEVVRGNYNSSQFTMLTGTCHRKRRYIIERLIFRKTQGHSYIVFKDREDYVNQRDMFICFVNKGLYRTISQKLNAILLLNECTLYELPNMEQHLLNYQEQLKKKKAQYLRLFELSMEHFTQSLGELVGQNQQSLQYHLTRVAYLGRIIHIITHSKPIGTPANHHMLTIHLPNHETLPPLPVPLIPVQGQHKPRTIMPRLPCLAEVNILTQLYSTPKHNEILPSVFMLITVPFLFGMMFSDMGHGLMLLALSFWLDLGVVFKLMGCMSIYCGFIYNEFLGMKVVTWGNLGVIQAKWGAAENAINFQNSLKMKISMIMAFAHMAFGMTLQIVNQAKRGQHKQIFYDSVPKLTLLCTTVGYLVSLIVFKWLTDYTGRTHQAPSIINTLLEMYLGYKHHRASLFGSMQAEMDIAASLNTVSIVCLLVMTYNHTLREKFEVFLARGEWKKNAKKREKYQQLEDDEIDEQISMELEQSHKQSQHNLTHLSYYHQSQEIHSPLGPLEVFEFVLSLISSTTSYLRLFALSLAHAKLSHLLLDFLLSSLSSPQPTISTIKCMVFFGATVGMMLALDVMECIMHVVRLHWVEWMGKFFTGSGTLFKPQQEADYE